MPDFEVEIKRADPPAVSSELGQDCDPIFQRIFSRRGVKKEEDLDYALTGLIPPDRLTGAKEAAILLAGQIQSQGRILIVADFDADGATSCALAVRVLREMGASDVTYLVPNRFQDGYGLTIEVAKRVLTLRPELVMTVDNGIASVQGIELLRAQGVEVLVTDHHLPGSELPPASVIVNPNNHHDTFPSKHLAGVGVVFYVMAELRAHLREICWFKNQGLVEPNLANHLDLVALGTVADVVKLDKNNRILVQQGIVRIRRGGSCPLIKALLEVAGKHPIQVTSSDLGFVLGPRLNAVGRLDDMAVGIRGLIEDSTTGAREVANLLDKLNRERKSIESEMKQQALDLLEQFQIEKQLPAGICVYDQDWHQGVIGILASRIKELYHRPVVVFADSEEDGDIKGSARSIDGIHIRDALEAVAKREPKLLSRFGGHAMAAGLTIRKQDLARFETLFGQAVEAQLEGQELKKQLITDGGLPPKAINEILAEKIESAGPWGQGFPEPLFDDEFVIISHRLVGENHISLILKHVEGDEPLSAIAFNQANRLPFTKGRPIHAAYRLGINEYRGQRKLQLQIEYFQELANA